MPGTQSHEGIAGTLAAIDYLAAIGREHDPAAQDLRTALRTAFDAIGEHENQLAATMIEKLATLPDIRLWGISDPARLPERVPTFSITHRHHTPDAVARHLAERGIFVWHGNFYAIPVIEALGLERSGLVRIGLLHYNTTDEIDRLHAALTEL